jgi:predicted membrane-bound spermidine synthase
MEKMPDNLTFILSADYLGGAVGTFFWIDFILKYVPLHYAGFVLAGINYLICIVAFLGSPKEDKLNFKDFQFFIGFAISLLITIALNSDKIITFTENIRGI